MFAYATHVVLTLSPLYCYKMKITYNLHYSLLHHWLFSAINLIKQKTFITFALFLGDYSFEQTYYKKVLLKLSSKIKFSQNLKRYEDGRNSITSLVCTAIIGFLHILWCGLLLYPYRRQCEKPDFRIK